MPVVLTGPFFERRTQAMAQITAQVEEDVAQAGYTLVQSNLMAFIRQPTPYYWTRTIVRNNPAGPGKSVFDNWVIYGPWLEGNGSRNFPKPRFRGYASYRRSAQMLERLSGPIADKAIAKKIGALN